MCERERERERERETDRERESIEYIIIYVYMCGWRYICIMYHTPERNVRVARHRLGDPRSGAAAFATPLARRQHEASAGGCGTCLAGQLAHARTSAERACLCVRKRERVRDREKDREKDKRERERERERENARARRRGAKECNDNHNHWLC